MKKLLFLCLTALIYLNVNAQSANTRSSISISVGPSFPIGDFANKDLNNEQAGLAKVGGFLAIDYGYKISENFGAAISLRGRINGVDENALSSYGVPAGVGASLSIKATTWKIGAVMAGVFQDIPLSRNEKLNLEIKALVGLQSTSSPQIDINVNVPGMGSFTGGQESINSKSFAYLAGAALKYNLSSTIALKISGDYNGAKPKFTTVTYPADAPVEQKIAQNISAFDLGIGLTIGF